MKRLSLPGLPMKSVPFDPTRRKAQRDRRAESVVLRPGNDAEELAARIERRDAICTLVRNIEVMVVVEGKAAHRVRSS